MPGAKGWNCSQRTKGTRPFSLGFTVHSVVQPVDSAGNTNSWASVDWPTLTDSSFARVLQSFGTSGYHQIASKGNHVCRGRTWLVNPLWFKTPGCPSRLPIIKFPINDFASHIARVHDSVVQWPWKNKGTLLGEDHFWWGSHQKENNWCHWTTEMSQPQGSLKAQHLAMATNRSWAASVPFRNGGESLMPGDGTWDVAHPLAKED